MQWGGAAAEGSPWVMLGGNTLRNHLLSGVVQLGCPRAGSAIWYVDEAELAFPHGWKWIKGPPALPGFRARQIGHGHGSFPPWPICP
jgi:hypothetical protein